MIFHAGFRLHTIMSTITSPPAAFVLAYILTLFLKNYMGDLKSPLQIMPLLF